MLTWLVSTSLRLRVLVLATAVVLIVLGIYSAQTTPMDVFPEFAPPRVEIQTEAPGLSTEEVELLINVPLESSLNGLPWLETIRSRAVLGLSSVELLFEQGTDLLEARQLVQERVAMVASRLPSAVRPPVILPPLSSTSRMLKIGIWSDTVSQMDLTVLAQWTIRPRLMAVEGVANVAIWGQMDRQLQVLVDPDRLRAHGVTLEQVERAAADAVALVAGGFVDTPNQRLAVRHVNRILEPEDLAQTAIPSSGAGESGRNEDVLADAGATVSASATSYHSPLRLGDVADVVVGHPPMIGDAVINDGPGLLLIVEKQPWANTLEVTRAVEEALDELRPGLQGIETDSTIFRPATFIETSLENLGRAGLIGCGLVILVLLAFLSDWRTALISVTAIPLSLFAAATVLHYVGGTLNTMILAGLIIALGEVVDDAIIDVENIARRLQLHRAAGRTASPKPSPPSGGEGRVRGSPGAAFSVVLKASLEVRSAVVFGSMVVVLVLLPVFFLEGLAGTFFRPLAFSYVLAIAASLLVALTVTPALSLVLLGGGRGRHRDAPLVRVLKRAYSAVLPKLAGRPVVAVLVLLIAFGATGVAASNLGTEFLPDFQERDFLMHWVTKPGSSLEAMRRITTLASIELRSIPGVRNFGAHIGRAEVADEVVGPNFTELWISIDPQVDYRETLDRIQEVVAGYPGLYRDVLTYLRERIKEVLTGASASIVVRIYGPDLEELRRTADRVREAMAEIDGVADLHVEQQVLVPQIEVALRPEAAAQFGLTPGDVRRVAATLISGRTVGQVYDHQMIFDVVVWGVERVRDDVIALSSLPIELPGGGQVPLGEVADVAVVPAPNIIRREAASRRIDVTCNVEEGHDLGSVANEIEERVSAVSFPRGYHPEFLGEYAATAESRNRLLLIGAFALAGILVLLHVEFGSLTLALLVFLTLPFAVVGGIGAVYLTGGVLSLGALIGFVTVLGIAARNGIMLVSHYRHLEEVEAEPFGLPLVLRGAQERLAPILMTVLTTALALVPLLVSGNLPGHEIEHPMAVVIVGGLVTSTTLNLFLLPPLYARVGQRRPSRRTSVSV